MLLRHLLRTFDSTAIMLVVVFSIGLSLSTRAGLFGIPLGIILISWLFKYAYVLLEEVAYGGLRPPVMSFEMLNPIEQRPLGQLAIFVVVYQFASFLGGVLGTVVLIGATLLLPASIAVLGISRRFFQALNPYALVRVANILGVLYLQVFAIVVVICAALTWFVTREVWLTFKIAAAQFALLAIFNVIGGALYERRDELDLDVMHSPEIDAEKEARERAHKLARVLDEIYASVRVRKYSAIPIALDAWFSGVEREELRQDASQIVTAVKPWNDAKAVQQIANSLIGRLQDARLTGEALDVLEAAQAQVASLQLDTPERAVQLAELAIAAGRRGLARRLLAAYEGLPTELGPGRRMGELRTQIER